MKLWKILVATMIALLLVCAVAMAEETEKVECPHIPSDWVVLTYPTCTEGSVDVRYYCTRTDCEWSKVVWQTKTNDNAFGHNWTVLPGTVDSTCTKEGSKPVKCLRCEKTETWTIEKKDHDYKLYAELSTAPTCTAAGEDVYQCRDCEKIETKAVKANGHSFTVYVEAKPATCAAAGYTEHRKCAFCDATELKNTVPATSTHTNPQKVDENSVAATCYTDGVDYFHCSTCGENYTKVVKATGNHSVTKKAAKAPTCTEDGYTEHWACTTKGCTYTADKVIVPASGAAHDWKATGTKLAATCTTGGYETEKCSKCGAYQRVNEVAALGHDHSVLVENVLATCTVKGYQAMKCSRCTDIKYNHVEMLAHNYAEAGWKTKKAANCTSTGLEANLCTMCGKAEITRVVEAKGHVMGAATWVKAPTCTTEGEGVKKCFNCTKEETVVIEALGHDKLDVVVAEPTCTQPGMKHIACKRENNKYIEVNVIIPATNHKDAKITVTKEATCTAEGERTVDCPACGKKTEKIAKLPHTYTWVEITKPSPAGNGKSEYKCACGDVADTKTVKYTKWYYNNTMTSFGPTTKELVGGNDWYRVTPVDVTVDGVYTYDLIASNKYVVGTVTITVNAGALTVSYDAMHGVTVNDEALLVYASKADLAAGTAVTANVGAAINVAETFGADNQVLVSLILTGDYDAAGKSYVDADAAAAMIANID